MPNGPVNAQQQGISGALLKDQSGNTVNLSNQQQTDLISAVLGVGGAIRRHPSVRPVGRNPPALRPWVQVPGTPTQTMQDAYNELGGAQTFGSTRNFYQTVSGLYATWSNSLKTSG